MKIYTHKGVEVISNKKITFGTKNMFQIIQAGGEIPASFVASKKEMRFIPKNYREFIEKLSNTRQLCLHFGAMLWWKELKTPI